jgi:hypothetical protein
MPVMPSALYCAAVAMLMPSALLTWAAALMMLSAVKPLVTMVCTLGVVLVPPVSWASTCALTLARFSAVTPVMPAAS